MNLILTNSKTYLAENGVLRLTSSKHVYPTEKIIHEILKNHPDIGVGRLVFDDTNGSMLPMDSDYHSTRADIVSKALSFSNFGCLQSKMAASSNKLNATIEFGKRKFDSKARIQITLRRDSESKTKNLVIVYHFTGEADTLENFLQELIKQELPPKTETEQEIK